jgi:predicted RNA-binding Zn-ribbon protein involved in translation (DUF1610 family)
VSEKIELPRIGKGTKIVCPKCGAIIGEFKRRVKGGELLKVEDINFFMGNFKSGDPADCPKCGFPYAVVLNFGAVIHTEKGWLPTGIPTKALIPAIERFLKRLRKRGKKEKKR